MVGIVIASHGEFCNGLKSSTEMIAGEIVQCESVPLLPGEDPENYQKTLGATIDRNDTGFGVLVLVDLRGGTPFNQSLMLSREKNIQIVIGANLPMLLVASLNRNEDTTLDELAQMVANDGKQAIDVLKYTK